MPSLPPSDNRRWRIALLGVFVVLAGCTPHPAAPTASTTPPSSVSGPETWSPLRVNNEIIRVQLAITNAEMAHGLMNRHELNSDDGMIFVYTNPQPLSYWMQNTPLPLDIGYFDSKGVLREIYPMYPYNTRPVSSVHQDLQYALEMNQGWFDKHHLATGAQLDFEALRAALAARGYNPNQFTPSAQPAKTP